MGLQSWYKGGQLNIVIWLPDQSGLMKIPDIQAYEVKEEICGMNTPSQKFETHPRFECPWLPEPVSMLVSGHQVCIQPPPEELREMAKVHEIANVLGLAAYPVRCSYDKWVKQPPAELDEGKYATLSHQIRKHTLVMVSVRLYFESEVFSICLIVPQSHSYLALGLTELASPDGEALLQGHDMTLLVWPYNIRGRNDELLVSAGKSVRGGSRRCLIYTGCDDFRGLVAEIWSFWVEKSGQNTGNLNNLCRGRLVIPSNPNYLIASKDLLGAKGTILFGVEIDSQARIPLFKQRGWSGDKLMDPGCLVIPCSKGE